MNDRPTPEALMAGVGNQLRDLRRQLGLTLQDLSRQAEVSVGLLSQMERGKGNPSFNTLVQVAHALDVPVARLLHAADGRSPVVRRGERRRLDLHPASKRDTAVHELLTPDVDRALEVVWVEAPPGYTSKDTPFVHAGEEVGVVLEGRHEVYLDGVCYALEAGDAISYASTIPHWYSNPGPDVVKAIWIITPPTF
jgi:transcriptional regulator with XRE-family HTH domain